MAIKAVIFDLDGTLLNTEQGTVGILEKFMARYGKVLDAEKESRRVGMLMNDSVLATIKDYDLPLTPQQYVQETQPLYHGVWSRAKPLPGVNRLMNHLHKHGVPFALASNSVRKNVDAKVAFQEGWKDLFSVILSSDQVKSGKPAPDLYLEAARIMGVEAADCLVIEDSLVGVKAGKAAGMKVVAVPSMQTEKEKFSIADSILNCLLDFHTEVWGLPTFEDWVGNALPIEPVYFRGGFSNGLVREILDDEPFLPSQLQGLYFGWARVHEDHFVKILISIEWEHKPSPLRKKIQAFIINGKNEDVYDLVMELLLVGYIRGLSGTGKECNLEIQDDDKSIADAALDRPEYLNGTCKSLFPERAFIRCDNPLDFSFGKMIDGDQACTVCVLENN